MNRPDAHKARPAFVVETLKKRADFLKAARAKRQHGPAFVIQARKRGNDEADPELIRVGFTCSKKVGNAVARNRAKRRLREIARHVLPFKGKPGFDYVMIGRAGETATRDMTKMEQELSKSLKILHGA